MWMAQTSVRQAPAAESSLGPVTRFLGISCPGMNIRGQGRAGPGGAADSCGRRAGTAGEGLPGWNSECAHISRKVPGNSRLSGRERGWLLPGPQDALATAMPGEPQVPSRGTSPGRAPTEGREGMVRWPINDLFPGPVGKMNNSQAQPGLISLCSNQTQSREQ